MDYSIWFYGFLVAVILFQIVSIPALLYKKNDLADVLWGPAFPIVAIISLLWAGKIEELLDPRKIIVLLMIFIWAIRLFLHIGLRNLLSHHEDVRYNNWRKQWGANWIWRSYLQVFVLQALILYVFLIPTFYILVMPSLSLGPVAYIGIFLWFVGMYFESVGDEQLRRFKSNPSNKGKLMITGLWAWTRHPNYFGEVLLWWGVWLVALELPGAWWTALGPLGVSYLILKISGVPMLEEIMRKRVGFKEYENSVPVFFPKPPIRRK